MRSKLLFLIFFGCLSFCFSQNQEDSVSLKQYFKNVEDNTDYQFFFKEEWIEGIQTSTEFEKQDFSPQLLDSILSNSTLNCFVDGERIYLLNNQQVLTNLPLIQSYTINQPLELEAEPIIARVENGSEDVEEKVFRIGTVKEYERNAKNSITGIITSEGQPVSTVYVYSRSSSALSDENGRYQIELPSGENELRFQLVGMVDTKRNLFVYSSGRLDVEMEPDIQELKAIEVLASRQKNIQSAEIGTINLTSKEVKVLPALLGEKDVIRVATLSAGVQNVGEGAAGINVRGGKADQNLFLLDNATIFNINHFFGFFTILNSDGISDLQLYKNGIPARLGGRLSSIFDIQTRKPKTDKVHLNGGIGPVTSRLMLDVPLAEEKAGIMIGGRATYSDFVLDRISNSSLANNDASFYDLLIRSDYAYDEKNTFSATFYLSDDRFQLSSDTLLSFSDFTYTNRLMTGSWKHTFNQKLLGEVQIGNSLYEYGTRYDVIPSQAFGVNFSVMESSLSFNFDYYKSEKLSYFFGLDGKFHRVNPGTRFALGQESIISPGQVSEEKAVEFNPYFSAEYQVSRQLLLDFGLRYNVYNALGPAAVNIYQEGSPISESSIIGTRTFGDNEAVATYHGAEFRFSSRLLLNASSSLKFGYNRTRQNHHLLINAASIAPTDVWRISGPFIKPQIGDQVSLGYFRNIFGKDFIEVSAEAYYKRIQNLLDFRTGAELQFNNAIETDLLQGDGRSYGIELAIRKPDGWLNGWVNYTYSRSLIRLDSEFPENRINGGSFFPTGYDKPHYVNAVVNYKFTNRVTITASSVFASGIPVTYPVGKWFYQGSQNILYSDRNEFRIPNYFRLDIGFNIDASYKLKKWTHSSWTFSVYNVLGRDNVYSVFFRVDDGDINGYEMTVFEDPIPTITYNFRF